MEKLILNVWLMFGMYILVLLAIIADLWSGLRKARKNGIAHSSYGFKRTVDKIARYYNVMLALSVVDAMQIGSIWYFEKYYGWHVPIFPFLTLMGSIGIGIIEVKSIYEKAEDKIRLENVATMAGKIVTNKSDLTEIIKAVAEYMQKSDNDETKS